MSSQADHDPVSYPTVWGYTLIGWSEERVRAAVREVVGDRVHRISFSRSSAKGTYCSLHLELEVVDRDDRMGLYRALHQHADIRMVI